MRLSAPSVKLLRALALLALAGASLALFAQELFHPVAFWTSIWRKNALPLPVRRGLFATMVGGIAVVWGAAAAWRWRRGPGAVADIERAAQLASPLILAGFWPPAGSTETWTDALQASIVVTAFVLALEPLARKALAALPERAWAAAARLRDRVPPAVRRFAPAVLVGLALVAYAVYMSYFSILNHQRFNTASYDLGIYDNQFWQALHGHPFRASPVLRHDPNWSVLKTHAELSMYALLPFYALHPSPEALLVIQSWLLAFGAIPIYRFARRRVSPLVGCLLALSYLLYAPLHGANLFDFHFQPLGSVFVLFCIDFLDERRPIAFAVAFVLALTTREDISIMLLVWGVYLVASEERPRAGVVIAAISALYFVILKFAIMPLFGRWWFAEMYKDLFPPDNRTYGGIIQTLALNPVYVLRTMYQPDKLRYALQLTAPLAFLPLRWPRLWWFLIPGLFFTLMSTGYAPTIDIAFQYSAYWYAMLFPAATIALALYDDRVRRWAAVAALVAGTLLMTRHFGAIPPRVGFRAGFGLVRFTPPSPLDRQKAKDLAELAAMIPFDAPFCVSELELPHVAHRPEVYSLKDGIQGADWILYVPGAMGGHLADEAQRSGVMDKVANRPGLVLLHRRAPPTPQATPRKLP